MIGRKEDIENRIEELEKEISRRLDVKKMYEDELEQMEQRYYVKLFDHEDGYLNVGTDDGIKKILDCVNTSLLKTEFTEEEIKEMDPRYWQFAIPVEDVCE